MTPLIALLLAQIAGLPGQIQTPNAGRWVSTQGTYQCTGTGCVSRPIASKLGDAVSVKDFGAVGDGVTDDSTAVANTLTAAGSNQMIDFPCPGNYKTTAYGTLPCGDYYPPMAGATGAYPRSLPTKILDIVDVKDFGAKGDGATNDAAAIQNALNSGAKRIYIPNGTYLISSALTVPSGVSLYGAGYLVSIIKKNFNGDLFDFSAGANTATDISFDGNAPTFTGRTIIMSSGAAQWFDRVEIKCAGGVANYCVEYTANCAGTQSWISNSTIKTSTSLAVAVKYPTAIESGCPRSIINTQGNGSTLIDFGGSNDSFFVGNFTNSLVFSANTTLTYIADNRIATTGSTLTISGQGLLIIGNAFAGDVILDASTQDVVFASFISGGTGTVTDSGTRNTVMYKNISTGGTLVVKSAGPNSIGSATTSADYRLRLGGSFTGAANAGGVAIFDGLTAAATGSAYGLVESVILNTASSGASFLFAGMDLEAPAIVVNGTASVANGATLRIADAPTGAGSNYALLVSAGLSKFDGALVPGARVALTYSATIATNALLGNAFSITATNGTAFTISNPTNLATGQRLLYTIRNTSGGALGAITWGTTFKVVGGNTPWTTPPATAFSRSIEYLYDGTNLIELWRGATDVPN